MTLPGEPKSCDPMEVSLFYYNNFNHPQKDWPISFCMKRVITVLNASISLTQCGLISVLIRDHFIAKLINLLIKELNNCSLWGQFLSLARTMPKYVNLISFL